MRLRMIRSALVIGPAVALTIAAGIGTAQAAGPRGWRIFTTVKASLELTGIAVAGQRHEWAVGFAVSSRGSMLTPVVMGWNGSAWTRLALPASVVTKLRTGTGTLLDTTGASGPRNMWAFSVSGGWLRWNGHWSAGQIAGTPAMIYSTVVLGSGDVWALGGTEASSQPYAAHYDGTRWKRYPVPGSAAITAASAVSSHDIWATLGTTEFDFKAGGTGGGLVHWFNGRWHRVTSLPAVLRNASLGSVLARSDKNVWVGGATRNSKRGTTEAVGHWNGRTWTVTRLRAAATTNGYRVSSMAADSAGGIWALASCVASATCSGGSPWRLWHEAAGRWSGPAHPRLASHNTFLASLAAVSRSVWATGGIQAGDNSNGIIALWGTKPS
jgi:hypothetical protein